MVNGRICTTIGRLDGFINDKLTIVKLPTAVNGKCTAGFLIKRGQPSRVSTGIGKFFTKVESSITVLLMLYNCLKAFQRNNRKRKLPRDRKRRRSFIRKNRMVSRFDADQLQKSIVGQGCRSEIDQRYADGIFVGQSECRKTFLADIQRSEIESRLIQRIKPEKNEQTLKNCLNWLEQTRIYHSKIYKKSAFFICIIPHLSIINEIAFLALRKDCKFRPIRPTIRSMELWRQRKALIDTDWVYLRRIPGEDKNNNNFSHKACNSTKIGENLFTLYLKTPADECINNVLSIGPSCRGKNITSKVVDEPASKILHALQQKTNIFTGLNCFFREIRIYN
uniref:Uncharacterized protein n=1 Tax=Romanomermis culicivorax TaxID=13658 RepID=A0A915KY97_ROMCU